MYIKTLNPEVNSLSNKIITSNNISFTLWLEFEETLPWHNIENDFANIMVNTLDGRQYGINVWTFQFLQTAKIAELQDNNKSYIIPPDLLVKELSRDCIEETVIHLLKEGDLEELLNESIFGLNFMAPYVDPLEVGDKLVCSLLDELILALPDSHLLKRVSYELVAKNTNNDEVVLELDGGEMVVLDLNGKPKSTNNNMLIMRIYQNKKAFWNTEMKAITALKEKLF